MESKPIDDSQLSEIFKSEYSNLIAVLSTFYGLRDLQLAEDIVSETFVRAMKKWKHSGVPEYPKAWLRKVAQNLLKEHKRRKNIFDEKITPELQAQPELETIEITDKIIEDSQLNMIFILCDPELNKESQLCLALRILCGFSIDEISKALLSNKETINKKLYRAKKSMKERNKIDFQLSTEEYISRLNNVLRVIYLMFNEGYYSSIQEENIRHEICWEAMRLCIFLSNQRIFPQQSINALIALMCFHASRFDARASGEKGDLLYYEQDREKWNQDLIYKGKQYLKRAASENKVSKYHLEAAIAYWHTIDTDEKWEPILQLYNKFLTIEYSPFIAMNRTYALAKANSVEEAIHEALKLKLNDNHHYYCLLAELYRLNKSKDKEIQYLELASQCAIKKNEKEHISNKILQARS